MSARLFALCMGLITEAIVKRASFTIFSQTCMDGNICSEPSLANQCSLLMKLLADLWHSLQVLEIEIHTHQSNVPFQTNAGSLIDAGVLRPMF